MTGPEGPGGPGGQGGPGGAGGGRQRFGAAEAAVPEEVAARSLVEAVVELGAREVAGEAEANSAAEVAAVFFASK